MLKNLWKLALPAALLLAGPLPPLPGQAAESPQPWELVSPKGVQHIEPVEVLPHDMDLNGKTVVLRWNGKPNGDNVLHRLADLLNRKFEGIKVIKSWEVDKNASMGGTDRAAFGGTDGVADLIAGMGPNLVIASQGD